MSRWTSSAANEFSVGQRVRLNFWIEVHGTRIEEGTAGTVRAVKIERSDNWADLPMVQVEFDGGVFDGFRAEAAFSCL